MEKRILTAESVTIGHPDKLADLIADSILDACLEQDKNSRVACEVMLSGQNVFVVGEIKSLADVNFEFVAKKIINSAGYNTDNLNVRILIREQSADISQAVEKDELGAGDQGIVYGYATDETLSYMPLPITLAHRLTDRLTYCREKGIIKGLMPDGKAQVSIEYINGRISKIVSVVVSAQHKKNKDLDKLQEEIKEKVIEYVFKDIGLDKDTEILINPSGRFVIGGFEADTGLTGRKLMVDTYGSSARHGGGAFSGKDASKVDRSGAYMARYIAKNIVAAGLAEKCEVAISYAIGKSEPTSLDINTFYTATINESLIKKAVLKIFDLRPGKIIEHLELRTPIYSKTSIGGHFGTDNFSWERIDKASSLKQEVMRIN